MFDIGSSELLLIAVVALLVIGPKDLPRLLHTVGKWVSKARAMTGHFKSGLEAMAREVEIEEMEKQWAAHNERILKEYPPAPDDGAASPVPGADPMSTDQGAADPVVSGQPAVEPMLPLASAHIPDDSSAEPPAT